MTDVLTLRIVKPGLQTTIQDHGREAYHGYGVPKCGPMDTRSAKFANSLVGNPEFTPVMEFGLSGPEIELEGNGAIALTGASFEAMFNGTSIPNNALVTVKDGGLLKLGHAKSGCYGYLAVAGKWKLSSWLESVSTSPQNPTELTPDSICSNGSSVRVESNNWVSPNSISAEPLVHPNELRVIAGPEYSRFDIAVLKEFLSKQFTVSPSSNRMGYRLIEPISKYHSPIEIISSGVTPGTIQVTHSGQLIVLMADAQTTGGYPRIANIITQDLWALAQKKPGEQVKFSLTSLRNLRTMQ